MRTLVLSGWAALALAGAAALVVASIPSTASAHDATRTVSAVRIDAHGRASGVVLSDGTELVGMAPFAGCPASSVLAGDPVSVSLGAGDRVQLVDRRTLQICDVGPREMVELEPLVGGPIGGGPPDATIERGPAARIDDWTKLTRVFSDGHVKMITHAPNGAPSGFVMEDGTQVHVLPRVADFLREMPIGALVHVDGLGTRTRNGTGMWALAVTRPDGLVWLDVLRGRTRAPELGL